MLLQWGNFTLHSGDKTWWRIDCDSFTDSEVALIATMMHEKLGYARYVICPKSHEGSFTNKLRHIYDDIKNKNYRVGTTIDTSKVIILDDVLTTGNSMEEEKKKFISSHSALSENIDYNFVGGVVFARGECPEWITPLFKVM